MAAAASDAPVDTTVDDVPTLESVDVNQAMADAMDARAGKQQKRYAKAMAKLGLVPQPNVMAVSVKCKTMAFSVHSPEVYHFPNTTSFVLFGEVRLDDAQESAARTVTAADARVRNTGDELMNKLVHSDPPFHWRRAPRG